MTLRVSIVGDRVVPDPWGMFVIGGLARIHYKGRAYAIEGETIRAVDERLTDAVESSPLTTTTEGDPYGEHP